MRYKKKEEFFVPSVGFIHAAMVTQLMTRPFCAGKRTTIVIDFDPKKKKTYIKYYEEKESRE